MATAETGSSQSFKGIADRHAVSTLNGGVAYARLNGGHLVSDRHYLIPKIQDGGCQNKYFRGVNTEDTLKCVYQSTWYWSQCALDRTKIQLTRSTDAESGALKLSSNT